MSILRRPGGLNISLRSEEVTVSRHEAVGETVRTGTVMREHDHHEGLYPYDTERLLGGPLIEERAAYLEKELRIRHSSSGGQSS
jgi:hypothetical protein